MRHVLADKHVDAFLKSDCVAVKAERLLPNELAQCKASSLLLPAASTRLRGLRGLYQLILFQLQRV